jgi:sulfite reductase (NADPH) flavoprotein alpha-component
LQAPDFGKVSSVTVSTDPAAAARIRFARDDSGSRPTSVYVDPYDGHVLGVPRGEDFFITVRRLHRWLLIPGDLKGYGRQVTGVVVLGLIALLISGLVLRWPRRSSVKIWLKPNFRIGGRGFHWSLHSVAGTWVIVIYLVMALTGLWYSFDWYRSGAIWIFSDRPAKPAAAQPKSPPPPRSADAAPLTLERAWPVFLQSQGARYTKALITLPSRDSTAVRIRSWSQDAWHDGARDEFRIDAVTGRVISSDIYAQKPFGEKVLANVLDIHRGTLLGWPGRLLFMLAALCMPLLAVTGLLLYFSRRKHRRLTHQPLGHLVPGE